MRKVGKKVLYQAATTTNAAPSTTAGPWNPVGDADFVLINHNCTGTTSVVWEFYTRCSNEDASLSFVGLDATLPADPGAGEHTTTQGALEPPLLFDVRGVDEYAVRYKTRTGADEALNVLATLCKTSQ